MNRTHAFFALPKRQQMKWLCAGLLLGFGGLESSRHFPAAFRHGPNEIVLLLTFPAMLILLMAMRLRSVSWTLLFTIALCVEVYAQSRFSLPIPPLFANPPVSLQESCLIFGLPLVLAIWGTRIGMLSGGRREVEKYAALTCISFASLAATPLFTGGKSAWQAFGFRPTGTLSTRLRFRFENLGPIPRSEPMQRIWPYAMVRYMSPDGNTIAGAASEEFGNGIQRTNAQHAFVWSQQYGIRDVGDAIGRPYSSTINTASEDGQAVAGTWSAPYTTSNFVRYADGALITDLQIPAEAGRVNSFSHLYSSAFSPDGKYFVGSTARRTFRWAENAEPVLLPELSGSKVVAIGEECRWIIGSGSGHGFIWTPQAGVIDFSPESVPYGTQMQCASRSGQFAVGNNGNDLFLWSRATGLRKIGELPWDNQQSPIAAYSGAESTLPGQKPVSMAYYPSLHISDDGQMIVGQSQMLHIRGMTPFLWTARDGMMLIREILETTEAPGDIVKMPVEAIALSPNASNMTGISCDTHGNLIRWRLYINR